MRLDGACAQRNAIRQEKRKSGAEAGGGEALDGGGVARSLSPRSDSLLEHSDLTQMGIEVWLVRHMAQ